MSESNKIKKLSLFPFLMITLAVFLTVRNFPSIAETGMLMFFFLAVAVIGFLIPCALISAELSTGWPQAGGVYIWAKEAFGERAGFTAIWLQWFQITIGIVMILAAIADTLAYAIGPSVENSKLFILAVSLIVYWGATAVNMKGLNVSGKVSTVCLIFGVILPAVLIIFLGAIYVTGGNPVNFDTSLTINNIFPDLSDIQNLTMLAGVIQIFIGLEVSAVHINNLENPQRNYPLAIMISGIVCVILSLLGSLSVAAVIPQGKINLVAGIIVVLGDLLMSYGLSFLIPVVAVLIAMGGIGQVSTWILGPSTGLLVSAHNGNLPPVLQKTNDYGVPVNLLILQAVFVSCFSFLFAVIPGINSAYWDILALMTLAYGTMYLIMYLSAIKLRIKKPDIKREFKIPGGIAGIVIVAGLGFVTMLFIMAVTILPPFKLHISDGYRYMALMTGGLAACIIIPQIIFHLKKDSWIIKERTE